jgi:hypothetical protein
METTMSSSYRKRAQELREQAAEMKSDVVREHLQATAALWDQVADDEERKAGRSAPLRDG